MIHRRHLTSLLLAAPLVAAGCSGGAARRPQQQEPGGFSFLPGIRTGDALVAPKDRPIRVAFAINPGVQVIDVAGPWETFQDTSNPADAEIPAFSLYTVSENAKPVQASGGLTMVPTYTIDTAPMPDVIVVPHFDHPRPASRETSAIHEWKNLLTTTPH